MKLILTEKPSVARSIANTLGKPTSKDGYLQVGNYKVTWAVGHLVSMAPPEIYDKAWKGWSMDHLPMIPDVFKLVINKRTKRQFDIVKELMTDPDVEKVIFATDAAAEGELIARWIYSKTNCRKPVERLWISSLTPHSIKSGMENLKPASDYDLLFKSAVARARADWVVGLNATRAVTSAMRSGDPESTTFSVGRVQTPTLRKVVDREIEIENFETEQYFEVFANFKDAKGFMYQGRYFNENSRSGKINDNNEAMAIVEDLKRSKHTNNVIVDEEKVTVLQPSLFSLSILQQECSRKFGITVAEVLETAQDLYEKGLISYPRTNDSLVTKDVAETFPGILKQLSFNGYKELIPEAIPSLTNNERYTGEVTDHHAIIPTGKKASLRSELEANMYDFIVRRFIAAHHPPGSDLKQEIYTVVGKHLFITSYRSVLIPGWRVVYGVKEDQRAVGRLEGPISVISAEVIEQATEPPSRYTEATLLKLMEKDGLGTAATRASIIETLKQKLYIHVDQKKIIPTDKAKLLIEYLKESPLTSTEMTTEWETKLGNIQNGSLQPEHFNREIDQFVVELVRENKKMVQQNQKDKPTVNVMGKCPKCKEGTIIRIQRSKDQCFYSCNKHKNGCNFYVSGIISGAVIEEDDIKQLLKVKRTRKKTFYFKYGKTKARLVLKKDGTTGFEFNNWLVTKITSIFTGRRF